MMEAVLIVIVNLLVLVGLFMIALYFVFDKYRFQIERQFTHVSKGIHAVLVHSAYKNEYSQLKGTKDKLTYLAKISSASELEPYSGYFVVHNELVQKYNYKLSESVFFKLLTLLGFKPYPLFEI